MTHRSEQIKKAASAGIAVNLCLTALKILAGVFGRSSAMLAEGLHSFSDLLGDVIVYAGLLLARLKPFSGKEKTIEKWTSAIIGAILIAVAVELMEDGVTSIIEILKGNIAPKPGVIVLVIAAASIILQELLFRYTHPIGKETGSHAVTANAWHHRADGLASLGVLLGVAGAIILGNKWTLLDPLVCCIISVVIFILGIRTLICSLR